MPIKLHIEKLFFLVNPFEFKSQESLDNKLFYKISTLSLILKFPGPRFVFIYREIHLELEGIFGGKWRSIIINLIMNLGERRLISRVQVLLFDTITHLLNEFNDNSWPHSKHKLKFVNMVGLRTINNNVP